jgi:hypothetical protein
MALIMRREELFFCKSGCLPDPQNEGQGHNPTHPPTSDTQKHRMENKKKQV